MKTSSKFVNMTSSSTFLTLFCFSCHIKLLVQVSCQYRHWFWSYESGNRKYPIWVFPKIWRWGELGIKKLGSDVSNETLPNAAKCNSYSFYRFWVIKEKPTRGKITPSPPLTQIMVKNLTLNFTEFFKIDQ